MSTKYLLTTFCHMGKQERQYDWLIYIMCSLGPTRPLDVPVMTYLPLHTLLWDWICWGNFRAFSHAVITWSCDQNKNGALSIFLLNSTLFWTYLKVWLYFWRDNISFFGLVFFIQCRFLCRQDFWAVSLAGVLRQFLKIPLKYRLHG